MVRSTVEAILHWWIQSWPAIRYYVRTWVGRHQPQLMKCLINIQPSCRLYSTSMLLAISKRDKGVFEHCGTIQSAETWSVLRDDWRKKCHRNRLPSDKLSWIDQLKQQLSFSVTRNSATGLLRIDSNSASQKKLWEDLDLLMQWWRCCSISRWCFTGWRLLQVLHRQN